MVTRGQSSYSMERETIPWGKYGGRGVYEALSVCVQYYGSMMVSGGLHSWNIMLAEIQCLAKLSKSSLKCTDASVHCCSRYLLN